MQVQRLVKYITVSSAYILIEQFSKQKAEAPELDPDGRQNGWLVFRTCHFQFSSLSSCGKIVPEPVQTTDSVVF